MKSGGVYMKTKSPPTSFPGLSTSKSEEERPWEQGWVTPASFPVKDQVARHYGQNYKMGSSCYWSYPTKYNDVIRLS